MSKKLTDSEVKNIRELAVDGEPEGDIAEAYGISRSYVCHLKHGERRRDSPGPTVDRRQDKRDRARYIREYARRGETFAEIAEVYGISESTVYKITCGRTWLDAGGWIRPHSKHGQTDTKNRLISNPDVREVRRLYSEGKNTAEIADLAGITAKYVGMLVTGEARLSAGGWIRPEDKERTYKADPPPLSEMLDSDDEPPKPDPEVNDTPAETPQDTVTVFPYRSVPTPTTPTVSEAWGDLWDAFWTLLVALWTAIFGGRT